METPNYCRNSIVFIFTGKYAGFMGTVKSKRKELNTNTGIEQEFLTVELNFKSLSPSEKTDFYMKNYGGSLDCIINLDNVEINTNSVIMISEGFEVKYNYELIFEGITPELEKVQRSKELFSNKLNAYCSARLNFNQFIKEFGIINYEYLYYYKDIILENFDEGNTFGIRGRTVNGKEICLSMTVEERRVI